MAAKSIGYSKSFAYFSICQHTGLSGIAKIRRSQFSIPCVDTLEACLYNFRSRYKAFSSIQQLSQHIADHHTLQSKRKIPGIAQERHFKYLKSMNQRNTVLPLRQAVIVPHLPEKAAYNTGQCCPYRTAPVSGRHL